MKIGFLTTSASRRAGGLFWAMRSLSRQLLASGCSVEVFAGSDRYSRQDRVKWGEVPVHCLSVKGPAAFGYMPDANTRLVEAELDLLHTHGLWTHSSVAADRWGQRSGKPRMVSVHGMLHSWALRNARWKKRLAAVVYENHHLKDAACLHALSDEEATAFRSFGLTNPVAVIPNGVELPDPQLRVPGPAWCRDLPGESRVLLYLGRLHPIKGLVNLVHAWKRLTSWRPPPPWHLVIAGWDQVNHRAVLTELVDSLSIGDSVHFVGEQYGQDKAATLVRADAFVLPSFSEGLPMAVLEAWAHGLPVIMTRQCNLPEGLAKGAALVVEPDVNDLEIGLKELLGMSSEQLAAMGASGRALVEERFTWRQAAERMLAVYSWLTNSGPEPKDVRLD